MSNSKFSKEELAKIREFLINYFLREEIHNTKESAAEAVDEGIALGVIDLAYTTDENEKFGIEVHYDFTNGHMRTYVSELGAEDSVKISDETLVEDAECEIDPWISFDSLIEGFDTETGEYEAA